MPCFSLAQKKIVEKVTNQLGLTTQYRKNKKNSTSMTLESLAILIFSGSLTLDHDWTIDGFTDDELLNLVFPLYLNLFQITAQKIQHSSFV
eukprot:snap_masked-scaffold_31-processed-gene-3.55-mRNA-1 protein AED:1.00 eAED:1.00 QI:0/0/0/0/1/1/2/0/90